MKSQTVKGSQVLQPALSSCPVYWMTPNYGVAETIDNVSCMVAVFPVLREVCDTAFPCAVRFCPSAGLYNAEENKAVILEEGFVYLQK